jgi:hypothetical protein
MKRFNFKFASMVGSLCLAFATIINVFGLTSYSQIGLEEMPNSMKSLR